MRPTLEGESILYRFPRAENLFSPMRTDYMDTRIDSLHAEPILRFTPIPKTTIAFLLSCTIC